ncbi:PKD domain-containing protein [Flavobacterium sp.]|uniref:PKD domain-containing protein n=1 Tax=Flavobacterium sp. TaxID=239 RepID=UPI0026143878|nr:PKD domain-containing protein [Flavobacterium sp.]
MRKNYLLLFAILLLFALSTSAQEIMGCGTKLSEKEEAAFRQALPKLANFRKSNQSKRTTSDPYIIPIVFHILSDGSNIGNTFTKAQMKCRIDDVIAIANKDFNGQFLDFQNNVDPRFNSIKGILNIQFVAATVDPDGNLLETPGMNWHPEAHLVDGYDPRIYDYMYWGKNNKYYLDVVILDEPNPGQGTVASGHAFLPIQDVVPHVTFNHRYVGSTCGSNADTQFAKEMSHEFGHYFGLKHTFQDDCDPINDGMADTPPTTQGSGCDRNVLNSCNVYANLENLMDYNVNCQKMFSKDQTTAMAYWLEDKTVSKYPRSLLWQESNLGSVGVIPISPTANYSVSTTAICTGESVTFNDVSLGLPSSRLWTFEGGTPATSTAWDPAITYNAPGKYKVSLKVSNSLGVNTKEIVDFIEVGQSFATNYTQTFAGTFPPARWEITNPDNGLSWEKRTDVGRGDHSCLIMNNADNAELGAEDFIRLPFFDLSKGVNSGLTFDLAYTKFDDQSSDVLKVQVSTDCGLNWIDVYSKTHTELQTNIVPTNDPNNWIPLADTDWRTEAIDLSQFIGNSNVSIRFKNISGYGTRIWIDNLNVAVSQSTTPVSNFSSSANKTVCNSLVVPFTDATTGNPTSWSWSFPGGTPAISTEKNPKVTYNTAGKYSVSLTTSNTAGTGTTITKNDFINIVTPDNVSFIESFENSFPPQDWQILNPNRKFTWEKRSDAGNNSASCMIINNADNGNIGEIGEIILKPINLTAGITDFSFDIAYAKFDATSADLLEIQVSIDCGATWKNVYKKTHLEMETFVSTDPNNWIPTESTHWRTERILLTDYKGQSNVLIKFKNTSGFGSRIWIDNLKLTFDSKATPVSDFKIGLQSSCSDVPISFTDNSTGEPISYQWSFPGGIPATSTAKNPSVVYKSAGSYTVTYTATNAYGTGSTIVKNNAILVKSKNTIPYTETFAGTFPIEDWQINNLDGDNITWEKRTDSGRGDKSCMVINNADNPMDMIDEIVLKSVDFTNVTTPFLHFDLAYNQYNNAGAPSEVSPDKIDILISSDCGATWTNVYAKNQAQLQTLYPPLLDNPTTPNQNETNDWIPSNDYDWRTEHIDLSMVKNMPNVLIKIINTSGYGTRIWFYNITLNDTNSLLPESNFTINSQHSCSDVTMVFEDKSTNNPTSYSWTFQGGTPSTSTVANPAVVYTTPGVYNVIYTASNASGTGNTITKNNLVVIKSKNEIPFTENFEGTFPIEDWNIINPDAKITWEKRADAGKGDLSSLVINNADNPEGKIDEIILKPLNFLNLAKPYLHFDLAYNQYNNAYAPTEVSKDKIDILVSSDCGNTWTNLYSKDQAGLQTLIPQLMDDITTVGVNETNDWIPTKDSDWRKENVNLSIVKNMPNVLIKIKNTSGYGTRIWFDNFNINNEAVLSNPEKENTLQGVQVYPNPSTGLLNFVIPTEVTIYTASVSNLLGQIIVTKTIHNDNTEQNKIDITSFEKGVYLLKIISADGKLFTQKIIKK